MNFESSRKAMGFCRRKGFVEASKPVDAEVVLHENDDLSIRVLLIGEPPRRKRAMSMEAR
jgi:hypothetical protein